MNLSLLYDRYYMLVPSSDWAPMIQNLDLRRLCSLILDKTIADPDKYQNGLTKIFFRAGMLAALESLRSDRLNSMVTVVQKNMRRRMAVKKYQDLRRATIKIQTWWRGILARRLVEHIRREVSARRLQTAIRRFIQRRQFLDTRHAMTIFQSRKFHHTITLIWPSLLVQVCVVRKLGACTWKKEMRGRLPFCKAYFVECK